MQEREAELQNSSAVGTEDENESGNDEDDQVETRAGSKRRREAVKQSKESVKNKMRRTGKLDEDDEWLYKSEPPPRQNENCEICGKRFTVTAYSKTGPSGGLICQKCSKDQADKEKPGKIKRRGPKSGRRQNESKLLDGIAQQGSPSLVEMCIKVSIRERTQVQLQC